MVIYNIKSDKNINSIVQDVFDFFMRQNYKCKKGDKNSGTNECADTKEKEVTKKVKSVEKSGSKTKELNSIIDGVSKKGDFDKVTSLLSSMSKAELSALNNDLDERTRTFKLSYDDKESFKKYERLSTIFSYAQVALDDKLKDVKKSTSSKPTIHVPFVDLDGAIDSLGANVTIIGKVSKVKSLATLNMVSEERARIYNEYPMLQKLDISGYKIDDEKLGRNRGVAMFDGSDNSMSLLSDSASRGKNAAKSKGSNAKNESYGIKQIAGTYLNDYYRHEVGHAAMQQLLTREETKAIYSSWDKVGSGGFGSSDLYKDIERSVSTYATKSPDECFSEMFSMATKGHDFREDLYPEMVAPLKRILSKNDMKLNYKCVKGTKDPDTNECADGNTSTPFKNKTEAADFVVKNITRGHGKSGDFKGIPQEDLNTFIEHTYKAQQKYDLPKLDQFSNRSRLSGAREVGVAAFVTQKRVMFGEEMPDGEISIVFEPKYYKDYSNITHRAAIRTPSGMIDHEIGHYIINTIGNKHVGTGKISKILYKSGNVSEIESFTWLGSDINNAYTSLTKEEISKYVSERASDSVEEFGAEVFAISENKGWDFINNMPNKDKMERIKNTLIGLEIANYKEPILKIPPSVPDVKKPKPMKSEQVGFDKFLVNESFKTFVQKAFEQSLKEGKQSIKLNYRCPKGKYVLDSFSCGETKAEANKNIKIEKRLKKEELKAKKDAIKAKKEAKKVSPEKVKEVKEAIKKVKEEKATGKISKESVSDLKDALQYKKVSDPFKGDALGKLQFEYYIRGDHIFDDSKIIGVRAAINEAVKNREQAQSDYSKLPMTKETTKERGILANNIAKFDKEREKLIEDRAYLEEQIITEDLKKMTPEERILYRDTKEQEMKDFQWSPKNSEETNIMGTITSEQYFTAKRFLEEAKVNIVDEIKHTKYNKIEDAEKAMNLAVGIELVDGVSKAKSLETLNGMGKERASMLTKFPELQKVVIEEIELADRSMGSTLGFWNGTHKKMTMHFNAIDVVDKKVRGKRSFSDSGLKGTFRHEFGHAVQEQLFTDDEKFNIRQAWIGMNIQADKGNYRENDNSIKIAKQVSSYAITDVDECTAEMFGLMVAGKEIDREVFPEAHDAITRILKRKE